MGQHVCHKPPVRGRLSAIDEIGPSRSVEAERSGTALHRFQPGIHIGACFVHVVAIKLEDVTDQSVSLPPSAYDDPLRSSTAIPSNRKGGPGAVQPSPRPRMAAAFRPRGGFRGQIHVALIVPGASRRREVSCPAAV
jgi:hypothetical protein